MEKACIGSTGTAMVSDDYSGQAEHKKLLCREWHTAFQFLQLTAKNENRIAAEA